MLDFPLLAQYVHEGHFHELRLILERFSKNLNFRVLNREEIEGLFELFCILHQHSMQFPENRGEIEINCLINNEFNMDRILMELINEILTKSEDLEIVGHFRLYQFTSQRLMYFIIATENQEQHLLSNLIVQRLFCLALYKGGSTYLDRLLTDVDFIEQIAHEMDLNYIRDIYGQCMLNMAINENVSLEVFDALIRHGVDVNGISNPPDFLNFLFHINETELKDPLFNQLNMGISPYAKIFIEYYDRSPIMNAVLEGATVKALRLLEEPQLNINQCLNGNQLNILPNPYLAPEIEAIIFPEEIDFELHDTMIYENSFREPNLLMLACYLGNEAVVDALIDRGVDLHQLDNHGESALFYALRARRFNLFHRLIDEGLSLNLRNYSGQTINDLLTIFNYSEIEASLVMPNQLARVVFENPEQLILDALNDIDLVLHRKQYPVPERNILAAKSAYLNYLTTFFPSIAEKNLQHEIQDKMIDILGGLMHGVRIGHHHEVISTHYSLAEMPNSIISFLNLFVFIHRVGIMHGLSPELSSHICSYFSYNMVKSLFLSHDHIFALLFTDEDTDIDEEVEQPPGKQSRLG